MPISEEAIELLRQLLAAHYINGGVPEAIVQLVEEALKSVGRWFPDPQATHWDPNEGYM